MKRLGIREHLLDFDHLARGLGAVAIVEGEYRKIPLEDWVVIVYSSSGD
jgi:hypothetical protein